MRKKSLKYLFLVLSGLTLILALFVLLVFAGAFGKLPDSVKLKEIQHPIATEVYSNDGVLMGTYHFQNRQFLETSDLTAYIKNALLATEDIRFYKHKGIDARSLYRVFFKTFLLRQESSGGGSTLTQQLAKNLFPRTSSGTFAMAVNKIKEMITARRMEKIYTKDEILEMYLNTVSFGENTFGITAASRRYFNKNPDDLQLEEVAVLIGMLKATHSYNPVKNPKKALGRRNVVLSQMAKYDFLDPSHSDSLKGLALEVDYHPLPHNAGIAPYFRAFLRTWLDDWGKKNMKNESESYNIYSDGLKIYTTIDSRLQHYAEEAMQKHMSHLQGLFEKQWEGKDLWKGLTEEQLLINFDGEHRSGMSAEPARNTELFTWEGRQEGTYNTLDSLRHYLKFLQTGILSMDVRTAEIRAWVGGIKHEYFKYDHVRSRRQVGSTFKPLVYLEALEQGISPCDYFPNDSTAYSEFDNWVPRNADRSYGGYYSMKGALVHSVNTVSVALLMQLGIDSVLELSQKAGITSPLPAVPSLALGSGAVSLLEMVGAYQSIANGGLRKDAVFINTIEDRYGKVLYEKETAVEASPVCSRENAELMIEMLKGVVNEGTAVGLRSNYQISADIAGKTGTTQNYTDGWFIGFTPGLVTGVWVGGDLQNIRFQNMSYGQGAHTAMPIWADYMKRAFRDDHWSKLEEETFEISSTIRDQLICDDFQDKKPRHFKPIKRLKEKRIFKRLFRREKKQSQKEASVSAHDGLGQLYPGGSQGVKSPPAPLPPANPVSPG